jgi:hypothetical protein
VRILLSERCVITANAKCILEILRNLPYRTGLVIVKYAKCNAQQNTSPRKGMAVQMLAPTSQPFAGIAIDCGTPARRHCPQTATATMSGKKLLVGHGTTSFSF